jgi:hypothetical protein
MKHKFLAIIPVLVLLGAVFGYAASLGIGAVDSLGSGTEVVSPPEIEVTGVEWQVNPDNYLEIRRVDVSLIATDGKTHVLDLYLILKDDGGDVIQQWHNGSFTVNGHGATYQWVLDPYESAADIAVFAITVIEEVS